jgi:hypothetical protein
MCLTFDEKVRSIRKETGKNIGGEQNPTVIV